MPRRRIAPRSDQSALDNIIGSNKVPIIKKRFPRQAQANADARAGARYSNIDSRFSTVDSTGWSDQ